jgi:hypothetical protein
VRFVQTERKRKQQIRLAEAKQSVALTTHLTLVGNDSSTMATYSGRQSSNEIASNSRDQDTIQSNAVSDDDGGGLEPMSQILENASSSAGDAHRAVRGADLGKQMLMSNSRQFETILVSAWRVECQSPQHPLLNTSTHPLNCACTHWLTRRVCSPNRRLMMCPIRHRRPQPMPRRTRRWRDLTATLSNYSVRSDERCLSNNRTRSNERRRLSNNRVKRNDRHRLLLQLWPIQVLKV